MLICVKEFLELRWFECLLTDFSKVQLRCGSPVRIEVK